METPTTPAPTSAWREEIRATIGLAWPLVLGNLAQTGMTTTDVLFMGRLGPDSLAAGSLGFNLFFALFIFGMGVLTATSAMIAVERGRNRFAVREVRRTVRQGLWMAVAIAVPLWVVLWNAEPILVAAGQKPALAAAAAEYLRAMQWSLLPFLVYIVLRSTMAALERPGWSLVVVIAAFALNALANWVLVFGNWGFPALGLFGSGLATTFATTAMALGAALVLVLDRRFRRYRLFGRFWRADWPRFAALWRLGAPIGATLLFEVWIFNAAVFLMGLIGTAALAAHTIAIQIASLAFMVPMGLAQAATVRVGRAHGADDRPGARRAGHAALALALGFMSVSAATMVILPGPLIAGFIDTADAANAEVVRLAIVFLAMAALFQLADGAQVVAAGMLRGLHDTRVPMLLALAGYWGIGLPVGVLLGFPAGLGGLGIWIGLAAGLAVVAVLLLARWRRFA